MSFDSLMLRRRQEIEVEMMQFELNAWVHLDKEQQVAASGAQQKLVTVKDFSQSL